MPKMISRRRKALRYLYVAALAFNLLWLAGSLQFRLFDENSFLPSNSLRALAYPYYGPSIRESRFVGIALYELYDEPTLVTSEEILAYLFEVEEIRFHPREIKIELVADPETYLITRPPGTYETYTIGLNGDRVVSFLVPDETAEWSYVVALRDGERVVFVPVVAARE